MPVIIGPEEEALWLDPAVTDPERVQPLLVLSATGAMAVSPVSSVITRPVHATDPIRRPGAGILAR
jgi:putative SOS response-associated peptidase YedK